MQRVISTFVLMFAATQAVGAPSESLVESEARAWIQGFLMGYLEGREPPTRVMCPVATEAGLREELSHFRKPRPAGAAVGQVESFDVVHIGQVQQAKIVLTYGARSQPATIMVKRTGNFFCVRDALTEDRAREIARKTMQSIQQQKRDEIFQSK